jgi:hypothetical protein
MCYFHCNVCYTKKVKIIELLSDHGTTYSVISHHLNTVAVTRVRITTANLCSTTCCIKNIRNHSTRNGTNFDAHVSHKSLNKIKWKHTAVDPKLQLLLKKNIYLRSLFTTHTTLSNFCSSHAIRQKYEAKIVSLSKNHVFVGQSP